MSARVQAAYGVASAALLAAAAATQYFQAQTTSQNTVNMQLDDDSHIGDAFAGEGEGFPFSADSDAAAVPRWRWLALANAFGWALHLLSLGVLRVLVAPVPRGRRRTEGVLGDNRENGNRRERRHNLQPGTGPLAPAEIARIRSRAASFGAGKLLLLAAVAGNHMAEWAVWGAWFAVLGFLHVHLGLVRDRLHRAAQSESSATIVAERRRTRRATVQSSSESVRAASFTAPVTSAAASAPVEQEEEESARQNESVPDSPSGWIRTRVFWAWFAWCMRRRSRLLILLSLVVLANAGMLLLGIRVFGTAGSAHVFLLTFECVTMLIDCAETLVKTGVHFADLAFNAARICHSEVVRPSAAAAALDAAPGELEVFEWRQKELIVFYAEFASGMSALIISLLHYSQVLVLNGLGFSWLDFLMIVQMRQIAAKLQHRWTEFREFRRKQRQYDAIREQFRTVSTLEELQELVRKTQNDVCSICLMPFALGCQTLPCNHTFHSGCINAWLRSRHNRRALGARCPYCSYNLMTRSSNDDANAVTGPDTPAEGDGGHADAGNADAGNIFFEFHGQRYARFLPNFRLQIGGTVNTGRIGRQPSDRPTPEQVRALRQSIDRVQEVFPQAPDLVVCAALLANHQRPEIVIQMIIEQQLDFGAFGADTNVHIGQDDISRQGGEVPAPAESGPTTPLLASVRSTLLRASHDDSQPEESASISASPATISFRASSFSESANERQQSLQDRRKQAMESARAAYLARRRAQNSSGSGAKDKHV